MLNRVIGEWHAMEMFRRLGDAAEVSRCERRLAEVFAETTGFDVGFVKGCVGRYDAQSGASFEDFVAGRAVAK